MRNRTKQPAPLDLPPVRDNPIRIYGQMKGPMGQAIAGMRILMKAISSNAQIVQELWSETTTDQSGNYDFSVMPGKYAVFFERRGLKERVNNIYVYSDSAPGTLQSFMMTPSADMLTPLMVLEVKAALEEATAAMLRARQWAENPVGVPVLDFEQGAGPEYSAYHWAHYAENIINTDTNINWRKAWDESTAYAFRDAVRYQGSSYYCIEGNTGIAPPDIDTADNEAWSLMSAKGDKGDEGTPDLSNYYTKAEIDAMLKPQPGAINSYALVSPSSGFPHPGPEIGGIVDGEVLEYCAWVDYSSDEISIDGIEGGGQVLIGSKWMIMTDLSESKIIWADATAMFLAVRVS